MFMAPVLCLAAPSLSLGFRGTNLIPVGRRSRDGKPLAYSYTLGISEAPRRHQVTARINPEFGNKGHSVRLIRIKALLEYIEKQGP